MKTISINGKQYPCRATMGALLRFKRQTGKDVQELSVDDLEGAVTFAYCCVASACKADEVAFDMDFEQFCDCLQPEDFTNFFTEGQEPQKKTKGSQK